MGKQRFIPLILFLTALSLGAQDPRAVGGLLDLTSSYLDAPLCLEGEWLFLPGGDSRAVPLAVPGHWQGLTGTPYARGTYLLTVRVDESVSGRLGALFFPELSQILAFRVNGRLLYSSGDFLTGRTDYTMGVVPFDLQETMEISLELKNTRFRSGGLIYPPMMGSYESLRRYRTGNVLSEAIPLFFGSTVSMLSSPPCFPLLC